jgi:hypothetical protein
LGAHAPTQGRADGTAPDAVARRNGRNRANRARRVLARARATGASDSMIADRAQAIAGYGRLMTASGLAGSNAREIAQSARDQARYAPSRMQAPATAPVPDAPRTTGAGWAGVHATD